MAAPAIPVQATHPAALLAAGDPLVVPVEPEEYVELRCCSIYTCGLSASLSEGDIKELFCRFGEITNFQRLGSNEQAQSNIVEYSTADAAEEAQGMVNHASIRGKNCRSLLLTTVHLIQETMGAGNRILIECLDAGIESHRLLDVCNLFGNVLDCKVEVDETGRSRGFGFVHYDDLAGAEKALSKMNNIQIGSSHVRLRRFEWSDDVLFTCCGYLNEFNPHPPQHQHQMPMGGWMPPEQGHRHYGGMGQYEGGMQQCW